MKTNQRRMGVMLSYLYTALGIIVSVVYTPIMLRLLGQSEYGVYQAAASVISYLSLLSLGFSSSYMRFFARYEIKGDKNGIKKLNTLFLIVFSSAALISLIAGGILATMPEVVFGSKFTDSELEISQKLLILMTINTAISFLDSVFSMYVNAHERFIYQRLLSIVTLLLKPVVTLPLLLMGYGSVGLTAISTLVTVGSFISNIVYSWKLEMRFSFGKPDLALLKEISVFSFFIFLSSVAGTINSTIDSLLLSRYIGSAAVAIYEIGTKFNGYVMQFSIIISNVFIPEVNMMIAENQNNHELTSLMIRVGRVQFHVISMIMCGFIIFGKYFIQLYAGDGYEASYSIALLIMLSAFIPYTQNIGIEIQKAKNKHAFRSVLYLLIAICNVGFSIPFIKTYGVSGAAVGTALATLIGNTIIMNIYYKREIGLEMRLFWKSMIRPVNSELLVFIPFLILTHFVPINTLGRFIGFGMIYVISDILSKWFIGMNEYEKKLVLEFFKR